MKPAAELLDHIDALTEHLRPPRRPQDARQPECSPAELRTLTLLGRVGTLTMSDLAAALAVPLSTATRIVDHLVEKRLVERKRSPQDRRVVTIHFSRRGRTIHQYVFSARTSLAAQLLSALAPAHRAALLKHLRALHSCGSK